MQKRDVMQAEGKKLTPHPLLSRPKAARTHSYTVSFFHEFIQIKQYLAII